MTQEVQVTQKRLSLLTLTETRLSCVYYLVNVDNKFKIIPKGIMIAVKN